MSHLCQKDLRLILKSMITEGSTILQSVDAVSSYRGSGVRNPAITRVSLLARSSTFPVTALRRLRGKLLDLGLNFLPCFLLRRCIVHVEPFFRVDVEFADAVLNHLIDILVTLELGGPRGTDDAASRS